MKIKKEKNIHHHNNFFFFTVHIEAHREGIDVRKKNSNPEKKEEKDLVRDGKWMMENSLKCGNVLDMGKKE